MHQTEAKTALLYFELTLIMGGSISLKLYQVGGKLHGFLPWTPTINGSMLAMKKVI
jgi:hypothetical protein